MAVNAKTATSNAAEGWPTADDQHCGRNQRDHEEASVDRRVEEDGVDPEERLVDVALVQLRVLEDGLGLVLVEADHRKDEGPRHELPEQEPRGPERDRVERHKKRVSEEADSERDELEGGERNEPRLAPEE